jgi:predicted HTH transcriptional regulator
MPVTPSELRAILAAGEGKTAEFKRGLQRDATLARTLAAFANTKGGLLLVGVGDRGEVLGAPRPAEAQQHLARIARACVDPPLEVELSSVRLDGSIVVLCSVPVSPKRPHAAIGADGVRRVLVRAGSSNRVASESVLASMSQRVKVAPDSVEARVLAWIDACGTAEVTARSFARATGTGMQRARRAFTRLEDAGSLIGHGVGNGRAFRRPT